MPKYLLLSLFLLAPLASVCAPNSVFAQPSITLSVWPDKILYTPGETARFAVTAVNGGPDALADTLTVRAIWDLDNAQQVGHQPLTLAPGATKKLALIWKARDVLGCEARADLAVGGQTVAHASEYFNVCPQKEVMRVALPTGAPEEMCSSDAPAISPRYPPPSSRSTRRTAT